jgi:hypothetical protein
MKFYVQVHPWGFWKPVLKKVQAIYPDFQPNKNFKLDAFNVIIGIIWQTTLVALPIFLVIEEFTCFGITLLILAITSTILKFTWWNKLDELAKESDVDLSKLSKAS